MPLNPNAESPSTRRRACPGCTACGRDRERRGRRPSCRSCRRPGGAAARKFGSTVRPMSIVLAPSLTMIASRGDERRGCRAARGSSPSASSRRRASPPMVARFSSIFLCDAGPPRRSRAGTATGLLVERRVQLRRDRLRVADEADLRRHVRPISSAEMSIWITRTFGLKRGGRPKCMIQFSRAPMSKIDVGVLQRVRPRRRRPTAGGRRASRPCPSARRGTAAASSR